MKNCTDIGQSRKLMKILSIKSADMYYWCGEDLRIGGYRAMDIDYDIPCWSLTALLNVLPQSVRLVGTPKDSYWYCECIDDNNHWYAGFGSANNPVDACVEMILKLHERKML